LKERKKGREEEEEDASGYWMTLRQRFPDNLVFCGMQIDVP
jgi:hypothetical protein